MMRAGSPDREDSCSGREPTPEVSPMTQIALRAIAIAIVASTCACRPVRPPPGLPQEPVCIAFNAEKQEVRCPAPPESYSGDNCTCMNSQTREAFWGRVQGGM